MATEKDIDTIVESAGVMAEIVEDLDEMAIDLEDVTNIKPKDKAEIVNDIKEAANILRRVYDEIHVIASPFLDGEEDDEEEVCDKCDVKGEAVCPKDCECGCHEA